MRYRRKAVEQHHHIARPRIDPATTPFKDTMAFRRYGPVDDPDFDTPEDLYLKALIEEQGFDGPPHVVPRRLLDASVAAGERELFRGVTAVHYADVFRTGPFFVGRGIYGGGTNTAAAHTALR
jgi:hypothetical protein